MSEETDRAEELLRSLSAPEGPERSSALAELARLPERQWRPALERLAGRGEGAVPLLEAVAVTSTGAPSVAAVQSLGLVRATVAASALQRIAAGPVSGEVRKAARRGLHRLASLGIVSLGEGPVPQARASRWPVHKSLASPIDGEGFRLLLFGFRREAELEQLNLLLNEEKGILEATSKEIARARFDREARRLLEDPDLPWVELPADYARQLVEDAHARNAATGTPLPLEYLSWRERIGRPETLYEQALVYGVINAAELRWDPRYLDRSGQLLELELFRAWALRKQELAEFVQERLATRQTGLVLAGATEEARERMAVGRATEKLFDARRRVLFKRRLEETAYLLWATNRAEQARLALAAAIGFEPPDRSLQGHPFVQALVGWSLEVAAAELQQQRAKVVRPGVQIHLPY